MQKLSAGWVPHHLTSDQVQRRFTVATNLLFHFETEENNFVSRIVVIDETWVSSF